MLLTRIITVMAFAVGVLAMPQTPLLDNDIDPKIVSGYLDEGQPPSLDHDLGPKITSGYSDQEREQIRQAHLDAVKLVRTAILNASSEQYTNIYVKYFNLDDNRLVWGKWPQPAICTLFMQLTVHRRSRIDPEQPTLPEPWQSLFHFDRCC